MSNTVQREFSSWILGSLSRMTTRLFIIASQLSVIVIIVLVINMSSKIPPVPSVCETGCGL